MDVLFDNFGDPDIADRLPRGPDRLGGSVLPRSTAGADDVDHLVNAHGVSFDGCCWWLYLRHLDPTPPAGQLSGRAERQTAPMRITVRVRPGSNRPGVGGAYDGALVVRVSARAVDGAATTAALTAIAAAFGVRPGAVTLVSGATSRTKILDVDGGNQAVLERLLAG